ncbi:isocitrate/isopropylmalate dehydrogenase family protein [Pelagibacteraceae bacterium]|jgi:isocitrate/isopropylmalate dehydrogenase|nr:isocitrate/isopropylmalate dehydrogenase family protein [Pelagibacteraceae bacterium]
MKNLKFLVLEGDGIGPEITKSSIDVLKAALAIFDLKVDLIYEDIGFASFKKHKTTFRNEILQIAEKCDGIILGTCSHNDYPPTNEGGLNPSGVIRKYFELYANVRPARNRLGKSTRFPMGIDCIVMRENTEGFYSDRNMYLGVGELMPTKDVAISIRNITRKGSMRIAETGFQYAQERRKKLVAIHKANVLRYSDGLFLECAREVSKKYPEVEYKEQIVDSMSALIIRDPSVFDVILTTNLFGDNLSDAASEIAGGLGLAESINAGDNFCIAQAQHGSAPDIAGKNIANPVSLIGSTAMLLDWLGKKNNNPLLKEIAELIENTIDKTIGNPDTRTLDIGGKLSTTEFTKKIIENLKI